MAPHPKDGGTHLRTISQASPIERVFGSYTDFQYNPSRSSAEEFQRLRRSYGSRRGSPDGNEAWLGFRLALVKEFNRLFGTDPHDLLAWQTLCTFVGIRERFATCDECIRSLGGRLFNIVDVIDVRRRGNRAAQVFPTEEALQQYTKRTSSCFPYSSPKAGKLLRQLIRRAGDNTIRNVMESPLFPPPNIRDGSYGGKDKVLSISSSKEEGRPVKKDRLVAESAEASGAYSYVEFESEELA